MITVSPKPAESTAPGLRNAAVQPWYGLTNLEAAERLQRDGFTRREHAFARLFGIPGEDPAPLIAAA